MFTGQTCFILVKPKRSCEKEDYVEKRTSKLWQFMGKPERLEAIKPHYVMRQTFLITLTMFQNPLDTVH